MIVCGIDPSMTSTAICSGEGQQYAMRMFTSVNGGKSVRARMSRLVKLAADIDAHLAEVKPELILIEAYSHGSTNRISEMAEWGGILRWHLIDHADVVEVAPLTLKKFITGKGAGKKQKMIGVVAQKYGQLFDSDDEVDAFSLYRLALGCTGQAELSNDVQRDVVDKLNTRRVSQPGAPVPAT